MRAVERFYQYLDYKGIKPTRFEKDHAISNGYFGTQKRRSATLGEDIVVKIIENCPDLNPEWLLLGRGKMLRGYEEISDKKIEMAGEEPATYEKKDKIPDNKTLLHILQEYHKSYQAVQDKYNDLADQFNKLIEALNINIDHKTKI